MPEKIKKTLVESAGLEKPGSSEEPREPTADAEAKEQIQNALLKQEVTLREKEYQRILAKETALTEHKLEMARLAAESASGMNDLKGLEDVINNPEAPRKLLETDDALLSPEQVEMKRLLTEIQRLHQADALEKNQKSYVLQLALNLAHKAESRGLNTEEMRSVDNPEQLHELEFKKLMEVYQPDEERHLKTVDYEVGFFMATQSLLRENLISEGASDETINDYKLGLAQVEPSPGQDPRYILEKNLNRFVKMLVKNDVMASQFVSDLQKAAIETVFNTRTADGSVLIDRVDARVLFKGLPKDIRTPELFRLMEGVAEQAMQERGAHYEGKSAEQVQRQQEDELIPPYPKKSVAQFEAVNGLNPDNEDLDFVLTLLEGAQAGMLEVANEDEKTGKGITQLFKSKDSKDTHKSIVFREKKKAAVLGAYINILNRFKVSREGTVVNINRAGQDSELSEARARARRIQAGK